MDVGENLMLPLYDHGSRVPGGHGGPTRAFISDRCLFRIQFSTVPLTYSRTYIYV